MFAALLLAGCYAVPQAPDVPAAAGLATGVAGAIEFRTLGGSLDEPGASPDVLTLPEATRAALARVHASLADARQARLLPNPFLSVVLRFPEGGGALTGEAGLTADLLSLLLRPRRVGAADNRLRAAASEALSATLDALAAVQERYAAVQALEAQLFNLRDRLDLLERSLELARARFRAGEATSLEVDALDAQRAELQTEVAATELRRREERLALARQVGRPSGTAEWRVDPPQVPSLAAGPEGAWVRAGLALRPEVRARVWELAALGDEALLARLA